MPGRPRHMAKQTYRLLNEHRALTERLLRLMPEIYRREVAPNDAIGLAWQTAWNANVEAFETLESLSRLLDGKAGIRRTEPAAAKPRREYTLTDIIELDGGEATLAHWCATYETAPELVLQRLAEGWDIEMAIILKDEEAGKAPESQSG